MSTQESRLIRHIDRPPAPKKDSADFLDVGFEAEQTVLDFFGKIEPNLRVRKATKEEDRGPTGMDKGKIIDAVVYKKGDNQHPWLGIQITSAKDSVVRAKKMRELKTLPF